MYQYPYGNSQQLNLNWIISEIIELNKKLDPDYTAPTFNQLYPYANAQQLNLDWILQELKRLKELAPDEDSRTIHMIANALVSADYDPENVAGYDVNDIVFFPDENRLFICTAHTSGDFDPTKWDELYIGDVLTDLLNSNRSLDELIALNILCIGNSFNQDMFAYVPPILQEILPEYRINYLILYQSSAGFDTYVNMYVNHTPFTYANYWNYNSNAWNRVLNTVDLLTALRERAWDMVFTQARTNDTADAATINTKIIADGRSLLRAIAANAPAGITPYYIEWLARADNDADIELLYNQIHESLIPTLQNLGFADYVPIGTAYQNARTNSTFKAMGDGFSMLYSDNVHIQAGIPALLGAYVLADFIAEKLGKRNAVYASTINPTTAYAESINAKPVGGSVGMTHGDSAGINIPNRRAMQEIATLTLVNPDRITDCSNIIVPTPT